MMNTKELNEQCLIAETTEFGQELLHLSKNLLAEIAASVVLYQESNKEDKKVYKEKLITLGEANALIIPLFKKFPIEELSFIQGYILHTELKHLQKKASKLAGSVLSNNGPEGSLSDLLDHIRRSME